MENPFKEGDRVMILRKGSEAEAVVRTTWQHEVQVRAQDGELLWRTVKTILRTLPPVSPEDSIPFSAAAASLSTETTAGGVESRTDDENTGEESAADADQQAEEGQNQEPLVVIDLPAAKPGRKDRRKRSSPRQRK